jgi:hypothetical protein
MSQSLKMQFNDVVSLAGRAHHNDVASPLSASSFDAITS